MTRPIRLVIVDDQWMIREGLAALAETADDIEVVATAGDGREAVELSETTEPDVVLMDVRMPRLDGIEATAAIVERRPGCRVVMLTTFEDGDYLARSLAAGACGYLTKDIAAEDLAQAVRSAHAGIFQLAPGVAGLLVAPTEGSGAGAASDPTTAPAPGESGPSAEDLPLTARETDVLRLVAGGATNREIGHALHLSEGTVKNHVSTILQKLQLSDRTQAAVLAARHGLV